MVHHVYLLSTELSKLGKTTQFYSVNSVNSEKMIGFTWFYLVNSVPSNACGMVLLGKTDWYRAMLVARFYLEKLIGTEFAEFAKLGQLGTEWCLWVSVKYCLCRHTSNKAAKEDLHHIFPFST